MMKARFTIISVPINDDDGAYWFIFDKQDKRTVGEFASYEEARAALLEAQCSL